MEILVVIIVTAYFAVNTLLFAVWMFAPFKGVDACHIDRQRAVMVDGFHENPLINTLRITTAFLPLFVQGIYKTR